MANRPANGAPPRKGVDQKSLEIWKRVKVAYVSAMPPNLLPRHGPMLGTFAADWVKTGDPSYMDMAIAYCHRERLPILPELLDFVNEAMEKRLADGTSGTRAFRHGAKQHYLEEMSKFVYHGATVRRAAELLAFYSYTEVGVPMRASTLEKEFSRRRGEFDWYTKKIFDDPRLTDEEKRKTALAFKEIIETEYPITPDMIGERR